MAIGGYTTAILMAGNEQYGGPISGGLKDVWTCRSRGSSPGSWARSGCPRSASRGSISRSRRSRSRWRCRRRSSGSRSSPEAAPASSSGLRADGVDLERERPRPLADAERLDVLPGLVDRAPPVRRRLARPPGRTGRVPRGARQRDRGRLLGVSLARYKTLAFGISAAYAGVAGGLFAIASAFVNPDTFPIALSIFLLVGIVVEASEAFRARLRRDLRRLPAALGPGSGPGLAPAEPDHRGDAEAGRPRDRLRRGAHPADVRAAQRSRRSLPANRAADLSAATLGRSRTANPGGVDDETTVRIRDRARGRARRGSACGTRPLLRGSGRQLDRDPPRRDLAADGPGRLPTHRWRAARRRTSTPSTRRAVSRSGRSNTRSWTTATTRRRRCRPYVASSSRTGSSPSSTRSGPSTTSPSATT